MSIASHVGTVAANTSAVFIVRGIRCGVVVRRAGRSGEAGTPCACEVIDEVVLTEPAFLDDPGRFNERPAEALPPRCSELARTLARMAARGGLQPAPELDAGGARLLAFVAAQWFVDAMQAVTLHAAGDRSGPLGAKQQTVIDAAEALLLSRLQDARGLSPTQVMDTVRSLSRNARFWQDAACEAGVRPEHPAVVALQMQGTRISERIDRFGVAAAGALSALAVRVTTRPAVGRNAAFDGEPRSRKIAQALADAGLALDDRRHKVSALETAASP